MRTGIISLLFSACSFVLGALSSHAQNVSFSEEYIEVGNDYYLQNVATGYLLKQPNVMVSSSDSPGLFNIKKSGRSNYSISGVSYNSNYQFDANGKEAWNRKEVPGVSGKYYYVFYSMNNYYHLGASINNEVSLFGETDVITDNTKYQWKAVTPEQFNVFDPSRIKSSLTNVLGDGISVSWKTNISTVNEGEWLAACKDASYECLHLRIDNVPAGKYIVNFYGKSSDDKANVVVRCSYDDFETAKNKKILSKDEYKNHLLLIAVDRDGSTLDILVDAGFTNQNVSGILRDITKISNEQYETMQTTWMYEKFSAGSYYVFNDGASKYLTAENTDGGNKGVVTSDIAAATIFNFESNGYISYKEGDALYYVRDNATWNVRNKAFWDIELLTENYGENAYTIKTRDSKNYIQYAGGESIAFESSEVNANTVWRFISKEQYYSVYPTEKIKEMLKKHVSNYNTANVIATRDFSKAFSIGKVGSRYVVQQNAMGFNNKYTVSGLTPGRYIVELYAAKQKGFDGIDAKVYVNGESHIVSDTLEAYTFTVDVKSDGLLTVYEDELFEPEAGIGNMLLAFKNIVPEKVCKDKFASIFTGETLKTNTSYYINSIGDNCYINSIDANSVVTCVDSIYKAKPFMFSMDDNGEYRIANGSEKIGHYYEYFENKDNTAWTAISRGKSALGYYYELHNSWITIAGRRYAFWFNENNTLSLIKVSSKNTHSEKKYHYRMISEAQYYALYPQSKIRASVYNDDVVVIRDFSDNIEMSEPQSGSGIWVVKQTKSAGEKENCLKITINNLKDDKYVVDLYALKEGTGVATIYAHTGDKLYKWDNLTTSFNSYSNEIEVKGGTLILYVSAGENVSSVSCAINSIKTYSRVQEENSDVSINWKHETAVNGGQYRLYNEQSNVFLNAPGSTGMQLDVINSTLFDVEINNGKIALSYNENGNTKSVSQNNGIGTWGGTKLYWTVSGSDQGYKLSSNNTDGTRYIKCDGNDLLSYPRGDANCYWRFVSKEQYEALSSAAMSRRITSSIGKSVYVRWEQSINAELQSGMWMGTTSNGGKTDKCNRITVEGLDDGWYDVQMNAGISNSEAYLVAESETKATRTLLNGAYYTYSLPVKVSGGTLNLYIESKGNQWINVSSALKDIVRLNDDNGVVDTYIRNAYFAIPKENRDWNDGWEIEGDVTFEPAVGSSEDGFVGEAIHPEIKTVAWQNNRIKGARVYQRITFDSEQGGDYILSADVCSYPNTSILYAKVGDKELGSVECNGEKQTYTLELNIPADSEVEIGLRVGDGNNSGKALIAIDNFRLQEYDNYLKNPGFSDNTNLDVWTFAGLTYNPNQSGRGGKFYKYATIEGSNGTILSGKVEQKVQDDSGKAIKVAAGAYRLSADVCVRNTVASLFAKVGTGDEARIQKKHIGHTGTSSWPSDFYYREFVFIVPVASEVTVGLSVDGASNAWDSGVDVDNFHLVRIGDVEGADITSQIVNNEFTIGKSSEAKDYVNKKYGWETTTPGFQNYANDCAEVNYGGSGTYASEYTIKQVVSGLPNGWYRVESQGFYRYGETADANANKAKALMFANESYASVKLITDETGITYPTTLSGAATLFDANPTMYMNSLSVHVKDGNITLGVKRDKADAKDWLVLNNFKLYYLYEENVLEDVSGYIKNPSFETGSILDWTPGNLGSNPQAQPAGSASEWDKNYYYQSPSDNKQKSISQVVSGLPAGEYKITAQIKGKDVVLSATVGSSEKKNSTKSSNIEKVSVIFEVNEGEDVTIKVSSTGQFCVDNFRLSIASKEVYLYNVDAGLFFGEEITEGYDVNEGFGNPVGLSTNGTLLKMYLNDDNLVSFAKKKEGTSKEYEYINIKQLYSGTDEYTYTYYGSTDLHAKMKKTDDASDAHFCYLSIDPNDTKFGSRVLVENKGAAQSYIGYYGTTYMGWSGEPGFNVVLPLIPDADKQDKGVKWQILTKEQYDQYKSIVKNANAARMAAWPVLRSARRSKLNVAGYTKLEHDYSEITSTGDHIASLAKTVKDNMKKESSLDAATEDNYMDISFLLTDADCKQKDITWNNAEGLFKSSETTAFTSKKIFSGRHYEALSTSGLGATEFSVDVTSLLSEIHALPHGRYAVQFTVSAYTDAGTVSGVKAFARNKFKSYDVSIGQKSYAIADIVVPKFYVDDNNPTVTIGVKLEDGNTAKYVAIDNIRLLYLGTIHSNIYSYDYTLEGENKVLTLLGVWSNTEQTKNDFEYILGSNKDVCAIYLKDASFVPEFKMTFDGDNFTNKNILVYKKAENQNNIDVKNVHNVVINKTCEDYKLVDKYPINVPEMFTAMTASYTRNMTTKYGTLCLPFEIESGDDVQLYSFSGFEHEKGNFKIGLAKEESIDACYPSLFKKLDDNAKSVTFTASGVVISTGAPKSLPIVGADGFEFLGTFNADVYTDPAKPGKPAASDCYYIAKDKFWHAVKSLECVPFRSFILAGDKRLSDLDISEVRSFSLFELDDEFDTTSLEDVYEDCTIVGYYNANGQQIDKPTSGVVIVKYSDGSSRKVLVK